MSVIVVRSMLMIVFTNPWLTKAIQAAYMLIQNLTKTKWMDCLWPVFVNGCRSLHLELTTSHVCNSLTEAVIHSKLKTCLYLSSYGC